MDSLHFSGPPSAGVNHLSLLVNLNLRPLLVLAHANSYDFLMAFPGDLRVHTVGYHGILGGEPD
ncbi:MAG: hypothetical protein ABSG79_25630 [Bryobacteraceae bacterium]|jgi:hypothetical protein